MLVFGSMFECQIIDPDGAFVGGLNVSCPEEADRNYGVVAVVGCQSGGKSTLLNATFGTHFPVLDAPKSGRRRTTLGVWATVATPGAHCGEAGRIPGQNSRPVVLLDVEGSDSRERGDGAKAFESRTTLLSLALADIVVVNMWAHDIGRYSAANYELFETVFAHAGHLCRRARLFTEARPVQILLVVRDHDGESSLHDIKRVLMGDLENIWDSLSMHGISFRALFNVDVVLFPHKLYSPEQFQDAVEIFAQRFLRLKNAPQHVPLSGFEALANTLWTAVCESTGGRGEQGEFTLDLPKHASLAAHFKLGEIVAKAMDSASSSLNDVHADIEAEWRHPLRDFGTRVDVITRDALHTYDKEAMSYQDVDHAACARRREELMRMLADQIRVVSDRYMASCRDICMNEFEDEFRPLLGGTTGYKRQAKRLVQRYVSQYKVLIDGAEAPSVLRPYWSGERSHAGRHATRTPSRDSLDTFEQSARNLEDNEGSIVTPSGTDISSAHDARLAGSSASDCDEEDDPDVYKVDRFRLDLEALVEERRRLGELLLPGGSSGGNLLSQPRRPPWWKGLLIRSAIFLLNYLQATHAHRVALKLHRKQETDFPPGPTF